jgi:hypothetical protein
VIANKAQIIFGAHLVFLINCVHILTWDEMNSLCWLAENDIIIRDITDKIQQMTVRGNREITANTSKSEEGEADRNP